jgi:hypothetical protein
MHLRKAQPSLLLSLTALFAIASTSLSAQTPPAPTRLRGVVLEMTSEALTIQGPDGPAKVTIDSSFNVYASTPSDLAHVKDASFVGVTPVKQPDGSEMAKEIHIFPEAMRGTGEGSRMMTPILGAAPGENRMTNGIVASAQAATPSRMTNGTVGQKTDSGAMTMSVAYKEGTQTITIPANVTVTELNPVAVAKEQMLWVNVIHSPDGTRSSKIATVVTLPRP